MMDAESFCVYILGIELCPDLGIEDKSFEDVTQFTSHQVPLKVSWSDNSETTISKSFDNFYEFHLRLLDLFPREAGQLSDPDSSLECCGLAKNKEMVRKYIDDLLTVPPRLLGCPYAWEFFGRTLPPIPSQSSESTSQDFCLKRLFERNQPFEMVNDEVESEPKEEIETPVMESSSTTDQGPPPTTFLVLPTEVILKIFKLLDVKSKVKFERVCQWFRRHLLQTWSDVTHLVISGAFVGGLLHGDELEFELCRVRCYLMRCDSFSSVMAELDCIEHCNPRTQRSTGFLLLECYSAMFKNVTKVIGILSHSTKLTIFHIIQQCLHSLEDITLSSFSSDAKHHRGVLGMWDTLIGYLQDADSIKKIDIEVPGFALERLLEFMQNKQPRSVVLDVASSHMDNLTQNIIAVADTMSFHGQLRTLSFSFCTGIVSITDVFHGFTDIARETLRSLLISVRQGPKMEIVVDLLPFQELSDLVFNNLDWSKNCRRRVIAFAIELFVQSPHLNSKLVCKLKFRSALTNDRVEDFCNRIIEARNNVPPAAGLVMNLHSDLAINKIILANDYVEISIC